MKNLILINLFFGLSSMTQVFAAPNSQGLSMNDFVGVYEVKSCTHIDKLQTQPQDPYCDLSVIVVTKDLNEIFSISYILKNGLILNEETLKVFHSIKGYIEDYADYTSSQSMAGWGRHYSETLEDTYIEDIRRFEPVAGQAEAVHFESYYREVKDQKTKYSQYDYELIKMKPQY